MIKEPFFRQGFFFLARNARKEETGGEKVEEEKKTKKVMPLLCRLYPNAVFVLKRGNYEPARAMITRWRERGKLKRRDGGKWGETRKRREQPFVPLSFCTQSNYSHF